jgi:hypothetical protein
MSIIFATWETEVERITVQGQPGQIVCEIPSPIKTTAKME